MNQGFADQVTQTRHVQCRPFAFQNLDEARHVGTLDLGGQEHRHFEVRHGVLNLPLLVQKAQGVAQPPNADPLNGQLAQVRGGLDIGKVQLFGCIHGNSPVWGG